VNCVTIRKHGTNLTFHLKEKNMAMFLITVLLAAAVWLLWMNYQTLDGFNEDLKQLRLLVGHIERRLSGDVANGTATVAKKDNPES
jgi:hypothetical protein